jgi:pimeloyl-ACP methyl ester carboxylesterase
MVPTSCYATCAGREIHYTEWGAQHARTVIAWHGLARTGRDMDELAEHLSARYRVICPDTIGRGFSQWSPDPVNEYTLAFYAKLAAELMDRLAIAEAHWVGTSMGGAIGTVCASGLFEPQLKARIRSLVLNDNAPKLAEPALARIRAYAGNPPSFASMAELEAFFRQVYKPFGWLSDAQWRRLAETSARRLPDGRWTPHYDPQMVRQFTDHPNDYDIWAHYDQLRIPVLCLRGAQSDLVLREVTEEMMRRGPGKQGLARVVEIQGCGHAPALNVPDQLNLVAAFIDESDAAPTPSRGPHVAAS